MTGRSSRRERREMERFLVLGLCFVAAAEVVAALGSDRRFVPWVSGVAAALVLLVLLRLLSDSGRPAQAEQISDPREESLRRWISQTETSIRWSDSTRADWDRHLRPKLAREFQMSTGISTASGQSKNREALRDTGQMVFGEDLWQWVDPENIARTGGSQPAPGRRALAEILERLDRI